MGGCVSCLVSELACCCGTTACQLCCKMVGLKKIKSSVATRVSYALMFLLTALISWLFMTDLLAKKLSEWSYGYLKMNCPTGDCYGPLAVDRICFATFAFHTLLAAVLYNVSNTKDPRSAIQNGFWLIKLILWSAFVTGAFFLPNEFISGWSRYFAVWMAGFFVIVQIVLLIDFAFGLSDALLAKYEEDEDRAWLVALVGGTIFLLCVALAITGVLYAYFGAYSKCQLNQFLITFNLVLGVLLCILSCIPAVQEANPSSGLSQAAVIFLYCTYLTASALVSEPVSSSDDAPVGDPLGPLGPLAFAPGVDPQCNPLKAVSGTQTSTLVMGGVFTFIALAYSTSSAATRGTIMQSSSDYDALDSEPSDSDDERDPEATKIKSHLGRDDEKDSTLYSYTFFHIIFALAACYLAMLITNWNTVKQTDASNWAVGKSFVAVWVKAVSSWLAYLLYLWVLVAPLIMPDRF